MTSNRRRRRNDIATVLGIFNGECENGQRYSGKINDPSRRRPF